ncbi:MAG: DUF2085 domain-containing protein [Acidobacteria bacterium]|nr:DUF2085 domain-containing protein [Acidobacteriota bacterium]
MNGRALAAVGLTSLTVVWAAWLVATPVVAAASPSGATLVAVAATYRAGSLICHQHADRSFHVGDVQTPVCARCVGLYGGAAVGAIIGLGWMRRRSRRADGSSVLQTNLRRVLLGAAVPTVALWALEHIVGLDISNVVRCAGAVPLGAAVAGFVVAWVGGVPFDDNAERAIH